MQTALDCRMGIQGPNQCSLNFKATPGWHGPGFADAASTGVFAVCATREGGEEVTSTLYLGSAGFSVVGSRIRVLGVVCCHPAPSTWALNPRNNQIASTSKASDQVTKATCLQFPQPNSWKGGNTGFTAKKMFPACPPAAPRTCPSTCSPHPQPTTRSTN